MKRLFRFFLTRNPSLYKLWLKMRGRFNAASEAMVYMRTIRNGDVVIEIGANQGHFTTIFSHLVGNKGKVYAFEPIPTTFRRLSRDVSANRWFDNVVFNNLAAGDVTGPITLHMPDDDHGQASIMPQEVGSWSNAQEVSTYDCQICKLDDYIKDNSFAKPSFIKIDVEGAELLVLKGAIETLTKHQPLIYLEICYAWSRNFGYAPSDIVSFLQTLGYRDFYLCSDSIRLIADPQTELLPEKLPVSANLICTVPALHGSRMKNITSL